MADPYRGEGEATALRLRQLDADIARQEALFSEVFWDRVAPVWGVPRALDPAAAPAEARHRHLAHLDRALARARAGAPAERDLPPPPAQPEGLLAKFDRSAFGCPASAVVVGRAFSKDPAGPGDPDAPSTVAWTHRASRVWGRRGRFGDAPVDATLTWEGRRNQIATHGGASYEVAYYQTTIAPAAHLTLEPEGIAQDLLEWIGLSREIELADPTFDPVFVIKGEEESAATYLDHESRRALLAMGVESVPSVAFRGGVVTVRTTAVTERVARLALGLLATWHHAPSPRELLLDAVPARDADSE